MSASADRMSRSADRMIIRLGGGRKVMLVRHSEVSDPITGKTNRVVAETINAPVFVDSWKKGEFEGHRFGDVKLVISGRSVGAQPPLDGSWSALIDGETRSYPLVLPVKSTAPDGTAVVWEANMRRGSAGAG